MKPRKLAAAAYDEASSSDGDDDDSSSVDDESSSTSEREHLNRGQTLPSGDEDEDEDDDDDDGPLSDNDDQASHEISSSRSAEEETKASASETDDDAELPLQERLHRINARGLRTLHEQRERKRSAVEVASKRLAKFKRQDDTEKDEDGHARKKKKSKHAPTEASSRRSDFYRRGPMRLNESGLGIEIGANRYKPLDPRTNSLSGHLNEEQFEKSYEFLQDLRDKEIAQLKKQIGARKEAGKKGKRKRRHMNIAGGSIEEDESRLQLLKQEKADFERRKVERAAKRAVKKTIQTQVEEGTRGAYFLKRKEKKKLEFEAKMEELRKRGGHKAVEKALEKRRKKAKSRDANMFVKT
jgi:ribosomal RNA-processing protein 36